MQGNIYRKFFPTFLAKELHEWLNIRRKWKFIQKYLKKRSKRVGRNYREASGEHLCTVQNGCEISQTNKMAALRNWPSTWSDLLAMAVTPSFQLRIAHRLKRWTADFPSFERHIVSIN